MPVAVRLVVAAGAAIAALALGVTPGAAHAATVACGQPVTGDAVLERDLHCDGDGPVMTTGGVTLDLGGHAISGSGAGAGIRIAPCGESGALRVRNGTVTGFGVGVSVAADEGCAHSVQSTVEKLLITRNETGVFGGIDGGSAGSTLVRLNVIRANAGNGITTAFIRPFHVINNVISRNGSDGVAAFEDSIDRLEGNLIARNGGHGAAFDDSVSTMLSNAFVDNDGIGLTVRERLCAFKPRYSIFGNVALRNDGGGMRAEFEFCEDPSVPPPSGGNTALANANFQCILIRCNGAAALSARAAKRAPTAARHARRR